MAPLQMLGGFFINLLDKTFKYVIIYLSTTSEEKMKILTGILLLTLAQILAWFQSNSGILPEPFKTNYLWIALIFGPIVSLLFTYSTIILYQEMQLWNIRFIGFGIGYLVFIPLTWYFLGEEILTLKNIISFCLCVLLMSIQFIMK